MGVLALFMCIALVVIGFVALVVLIAEYDSDNSIISFLAGGITCFGVLGILAYFYNGTEPKPIDVYRGNTTLEVTYRDSIAVDSVVVWKDKKN